MMTDEQRKEILILSDTIQGEVNRMCVTNELTELFKMEYHAIDNIRKLRDLRCKYAFRYKNKDLTT